MVINKERPIDESMWLAESAISEAEKLIEIGADIRQRYELAKKLIAKHVYPNKPF